MTHLNSRRHRTASTLGALFGAALAVGCDQTMVHDGANTPVAADAVSITQFTLGEAPEFAAHIFHPMALKVSASVEGADPIATRMVVGLESASSGDTCVAGSLPFHYRPDTGSGTVTVEGDLVIDARCESLVDRGDVRAWLSLDPHEMFGAHDAADALVSALDHRIPLGACADGQQGVCAPSVDLRANPGMRLHVKDLETSSSVLVVTSPSDNDDLSTTAQAPDVWTTTRVTAHGLDPQKDAPVEGLGLSFQIRPHADALGPDADPAMLTWASLMPVVDEEARRDALEGIGGDDAVDKKVQPIPALTPQAQVSQTSALRLSADVQQRIVSGDWADVNTFEIRACLSPHDAPEGQRAASESCHHTPVVVVRHEGGAMDRAALHSKSYVWGDSWGSKSTQRVTAELSAKKDYYTNSGVGTFTGGIYTDGFFDSTVFEVGMRTHDYYAPSTLDVKKKWLTLFGVDVVSLTQKIYNPNGQPQAFDIAEKQKTAKRCYGFNLFDLGKVQTCATLSAGVGVKASLGMTNVCRSESCGDNMDPSPFACHAEDADNCYVHSVAFEADGDDILSHSDAKAACEKRGGVLASPIGDAQVAMMQSVLAKLGRGAWVGLSTNHSCAGKTGSSLDDCLVAHKANWRWKPLGIHLRRDTGYVPPWGAGEPDDGGGIGETAAHMNKFGELRDKKPSQWNRYLCNFPKRMGSFTLTPQPYAEITAGGQATALGGGVKVVIDLIELSFPVDITVEWAGVGKDYIGRVLSEVKAKLSTLDGYVKIWHDWFGSTKPYKWNGVVLATYTLYEYVGNWFVAYAPN